MSLGQPLFGAAVSEFKLWEIVRRLMGRFARVCLIGAQIWEIAIGVSTWMVLKPVTFTTTLSTSQRDQTCYQILRGGLTLSRGSSSPTPDWDQIVPAEFGHYSHHHSWHSRGSTLMLLLV